MAPYEIKFLSEDGKALLDLADLFSVHIFNDDVPEKPAEGDLKAEELISLFVEDDDLKASPVAHELSENGTEKSLGLLGRKADLSFVLIQDSKLVPGLPVHEEFDGLEDLLHVKEGGFVD